MKMFISDSNEAIICSRYSTTIIVFELDQLVYTVCLKVYTVCLNKTNTLSRRVCNVHILLKKCRSVLIHSGH